jgi:hypothetical protein
VGSLAPEMAIEVHRIPCVRRESGIFSSVFVRLVLAMFTAEAQEVLVSVAKQLMHGDEVILDDDQKLPVKRVGSGRLRMVQFKLSGRIFEAIEQNPMRPSRWGQLAREKHQVVQFRDVAAHKYVAVAVDGKITEYGRS